MIEIYNYTNTQDTEPLLINKKLLYNYKELGDACLVGIKRELTRYLIDYKAFQKLQQVNNGFFVIIDYLDNGHYFKVAEVKTDKDRLVNAINDFLKSCKAYIELDMYNTIYELGQELLNIINNLLAVVQTINKNQ